MKIKVRIQMLVDKDGNWAAYGNNQMTEADADDTLYHMMADSADADHAHTVFVTANVPVPRAIRHEVKGTIEMKNKALGGHARAAALSPERRREIARQGAAARWSK